jgi:hypothetical protein
VVDGGTARQATHVETQQATETFGGRDTMRIAVQETLVTTGQPDLLFSGTQHVALVDSAVWLVGSSADYTQSGSSATQSFTLAPALPDLDFALTVGASRTDTATMTVGSKTASARSILSFTGFETVTVPAGTFTDTCKFVVEVYAPNLMRTTRWIAQGSGVLVKAVSDTNDTQSLVSATVDGQTVTPR